MPSSRYRRLLAAGACLAVLASVALLRDVTLARTSAPRPDLRPFAHWVFTADAVKDGKVADAAGSLTATVTGTPTLDPTGPTPALVFAGPNDAVTVRPRVTPADPFLPKQAFAVVAWVRVDEPTEWGGILGCLQDNGPREKGFILGYNKSHFYFGLATAGADDGDGKITYLTGKRAYEVGKWYHVAGVYDGKRMTLYVNGAEDGASAEQSGNVLYADAAPLVIGRYKDDDEDYSFQGALREVLWCGHAPTAAEIAAHFAADKALADTPSAGPGVRFVIDPYLQFATRTSMTVMCETSEPTTCAVEYGSTYPPREVAPGKAAATVHEVPLTGLQPRTKYFYRVVCRTADGRERAGKLLTFQTAVDPADAFSFTAVGDTQKNPAVTGRLAKLMWEQRPHFVLHLGDVVDNGPDKKEWTDELFRPCQELFGRVPVYPTIGNHEKNHPHYYRYFSLPKPEYYYSFRYGNAEFFCLDTNKPVGPGSEQFVWLDKALAASDATWKVCFHHHPCYSSDDDDYGNTWKGTSTLGNPRHQLLVPLYEKHRVDVVMNGHVHLYERTWPVREGKVDEKAGVVYLTSGGGGGKLENFQPTPAFFKNQGRVEFHYLYFTVHGKTLDGKAFDQEGRLFDVFALRKE